VGTTSVWKQATADLGTSVTVASASTVGVETVASVDLSGIVAMNATLTKLLRAPCASPRTPTSTPSPAAR